MGTPDEIAIIGMACTFAGAPDLSTYWANILNKVEAIRDAPPEWIGDQAIFDPACMPDSQKIYTIRGGFLGDLARFDPRPFGIMPVALAGSEPDQFLALKASLDALADAGYANRDFDRTRTGIILGHGIHPHRANVNGVQHCLVLAQTLNLLRAAFPDLADEQAAEIETMLRAKLPAFAVDTLPGLVPNMMTGRIANRLDLMGPNYIIDGACASSILAIDAAVTELRRGRADMMLAGGINTSTSVLVQIVFCKIGALSRREKVRPFDADADGTLLGEGQGVVVLKRLEDALRDSDRIYAVIKGIGAASDGRAMGLMAPRLEGEVLAMQRAYANSGIDPTSIGLVEAHATGIPLGDAVEMQALTRVLGERRGGATHVAIGSVKSMIGHCIPAAGMASVIKMAMALDQKIMPPTLADACNPDLGFERTPFFLNTCALPWINRPGTPRRAALDAFGFGGINTHMILEESPGSYGMPDAAFGLRHHATAELFVFAAKTRELLIDAVSAWAAQAATAPLHDLAARCAAHSGEGRFRLAVVAADRGDLIDKLRRVQEKLSRPDFRRLRTRQGVFFTDDPVGGKLAFVFPGENSQYPHMLRDLALASPLVRSWLDWLEGLFERDLPHRSVLFPPTLGLSDAQRAELDTRLRTIDYGSESVFVAEMAIFALLSTLGVRPDFVAGHSTGENAALFNAGLVRISPEILTGVVRRMNAIFREVQGQAVVPNGTLLTVGAVARESIDALIREHPEIHLTMDNCPNQIILFGPTELMAQIAERLAAQGAVCTQLPITWAYHTPYVAPMADAFATVMDDALFSEPEARVYSCASAAPYPADLAGRRALIRQQYISRVRFRETILRMHEDGARIFVEVGPGNVLTGFIGDILRSCPHLALATNSRRNNGFEQLLSVLGQLFVHQVPLDLSPLHANRRDPAPQNTSPVLDSALPFICLGTTETERLRTILSRTAPAPPPQRTADDPPPMALSNHFRLMRDFLGVQDSIAPRGLGQEPVSGWTGCLPLSFPAAVEFVSLDAATPLEALGPLLGPTDLAHFEHEIARRPPRRQRDWLAGRIAARRAVAVWTGTPQLDPDIRYDQNGRPFLSAGSGTIFLSISHKDGVAVAAAADRRLGIDLERFSALRDPAGVARIAFTPAESAVLGQMQLDEAFLVAIAWSAKEAAAKSLGQPLLGRETWPAITGIDAACCEIILAHADGPLTAFYAIDGDFICTLATPVAA